MLELVGFESLKSSLLSSYKSNKLHHAIIIDGKKGIGKASFAKNLALEILNQSQPDLLIIAKEADKKEISVDKIRLIADFVNQTSAAAKSKFIIIDSACQLNKSSSNALLKILEEPRDNNFLILISHNQNKILPTIKSRCQIIKAPPFSLENFTKILQSNVAKFSTTEIEFLSEICDNSPAQALKYGNDFSEFYELFLVSLLNKKLDEKLIKKIADKNFSFDIFVTIIEFFLNRLTKCFSGTINNFYFTEAENFLTIKQKFSIKKIFSLSDEISNSLNKTRSLNLDKKLTLINIFNRILAKA